MAHARIVLTEFLADEALASLSPQAILFILGAASLADPNGVLENRPLRIKVASMPHCQVDVSIVISELVSSGTLLVSECGNYLKISAFKTWFKAFPNERVSVESVEFSRGTPVEHSHALPMHGVCMAHATDKYKYKDKDKDKDKKTRNNSITTGYTDSDFTLMGDVWQAYPRGTTSGGAPASKGNKQKALAQIKRVMAECGLSRQDVFDVIAEYRKHPKVIEGYVQAAETFFGPNGRWFEVWDMVRYSRSKNVNAS